MSHSPGRGGVGDVVIVLPCFNESAVIAQSLGRLREWFPQATLLVIDDGSVDDTSSRAQAASSGDPAVRIHRLRSNGGKGHAVASAAALVDGHRLVIIVDADLAYGREDIQRAIGALERADVVIGSRKHRDSTYAVPVRQFGFLYRRHILGMAFNATVRLLLGLRERDTQCGLKGFRTQAFQDVIGRLRTTGFAFDLEILLLAHALECRIEEIPVNVVIDSGKSSVRLARDGATALREILTLAARRAGGRYRRIDLPGR